MEHLNTEILARLVDHAPQPEEAAHIAECDACSTELEAMRSQTDALRSLPEIRPPQGDWHGLEARLRSEGLVNDAGRFRRMGLAHTPGWMRAAAAVMLFLSGTGAGALLTSPDAPESLGDLAILSNAATFANSSVEEAATAVRVAEQNYVRAITRYQQLLISESGVEGGSDPMSRMAALEYLATVSQAAVRQAPGDPFMNGLLLSVLGEREATAQLMASRSPAQFAASRNNWF